jgi:hypothetical protein
MMTDQPPQGQPGGQAPSQGQHGHSSSSRVERIGSSSVGPPERRSPVLTDGPAVHYTSTAGAPAAKAPIISIL